MTAVTLAAWALATLAACPGQDKLPAQPPAKNKVAVTVVVILASEQCVHVDPRLKEIAAEVRKLDPNLVGFTLVNMSQQSVAAEEKAIFACVEDRNVEIVIRHCVDKNNKVCVAVTAPTQNEIVYRIVCGKFLPIVTRYQTRERISPRWVAVAISQAMAGGPFGPWMGAETLIDRRCRDRLILAVRVQPCQGK